MDVRQYADLFLSESRDHLTAFNHLLLDWERDPTAQDPVGGIFRAVHAFMGMLLLPSVPSLVIDSSSAVLTSAYLNFGNDQDFVFCVETQFMFAVEDDTLRGYFLLVPDFASLRAILQAVRLT